LPTITSKTLGSNVWAAGPAAVVVRTDSPWGCGLLVKYEAEMRQLEAELAQA
jgi:hypothetical protein